MKTWQLAIGLGTVFVIGIIVVVLVRLQLPPTSTPTARLDIEIAKAALTGCIVAVITAVFAKAILEKNPEYADRKASALVLVDFTGDQWRPVQE